MEPAREQMDWGVLAEKTHFHARAFANELQVSLRQLERLFLQRYGKPPQQWLDERRIMIAAHALASGSRVKEVYLELGFCDRSNFSRRFASLFGCSPREFASMARESYQKRLRELRTDSNARIPLEWLDPFPFATRYLVSHRRPLGTVPRSESDVLR